MEQTSSVIEQVRRLLDDVPEPSEPRLGPGDWAPVRSTMLRRLFPRSATERAQHRAAGEAMLRYHGLERQLRDDQASDRAAARKCLANAKGSLVNSRFTVRPSDEIASRWSRRLAEAIRARAVAERMRQMPIGRAEDFGATSEGIQWLRSAHARNLREASVLVVDVPEPPEHTWYSKITGLIGPHSGVSRLEFERMEESLGCPAPLPGLVASIAAAGAHARRSLETTLPTADAILERWKCGSDGASRLMEVRGKCEAEELVRTAEVHIVRMRWRSALISRVRAATRSLIAERARALDASMTGAPA